MRFQDPGRFTDLNEFSYPDPPNVLIRKEDIDSEEILTAADLFQRGIPRRVIWEPTSGTKYYMELRPYVHPAGAGSLVIGSLAYSASNIATYTPSNEGRLLGEDGALTGLNELNGDVAGAMFTDYYLHFHDNWSQRENFRVTQIEEGDFLWVAARGRIELDLAAAANAGDMLKGAANGEVTPSVTPPTSVAEIIDNTTDVWGRGLAQCITTIGAAGLTLCDLRLRNKYA